MQTSIALVGIGGYGHIYVNELLDFGAEHNVRVVAGIDPNPERCARLDEVRSAGIPLFPDLESFYRDNTADLVVISAPIHLHAPLTCLALSKGSNVLCEKPLAATLEEAEQMRAAEQQSGKLVAIGYQWSYSKTILALKSDILAGRFGRALKMKSVVLWPRWRSYFQRSPWSGRIRMEDGSYVYDSPLHNATAHYLHNMLFLLGDKLETSALPASEEVELYRANPIENFDAGALRLMTDQGVEMLFLTAHPVNIQRGPLARFEFEEAVIEYPSEEGAFKAYFRDGAQVDYGSPDASKVTKLWQMVEAIETGKAVVCGIETALPELRCITGAQRAPIYDFPQELIRTEENADDRLIYVDGLYETLLECYESERLPHEIQSTAWARPATKVSLR